MVTPIHNFRIRKITAETQATKIQFGVTPRALARDGSFVMSNIVMTIDEL